MILGLSRIQTMLAGGLTAILALTVVWALIERGQARHYRKQFDAEHAARITEGTINRQSIANLEGIIADKNRETEARGKALQDAKAQDEANRQQLARLAASNDAARASLRAVAAEAERIGGNAACRVPSAVTAALAGL